jgi:hypothetical protein
VNSCANHAEGRRTYETLRKACESFLKYAPPLLGVVRRDPKVLESIRNQIPLLTRFPNCNAADDVGRPNLTLAARRPRHAPSRRQAWQPAPRRERPFPLIRRLPLLRPRRSQPFRRHKAAPRRAFRRSPLPHRGRPQAPRFNPQRLRQTRHPPRPHRQAQQRRAHQPRTPQRPPAHILARRRPLQQPAPFPRQRRRQRQRHPQRHRPPIPPRQQGQPLNLRHHRRAALRRPRPQAFSPSSRKFSVSTSEFLRSNTLARPLRTPQTPRPRLKGRRSAVPSSACLAPDNRS